MKAINCCSLFTDFDFFSCSSLKTNEYTIGRQTPQMREAIDAILGTVAWEYKYKYSWIAQDENGKQRAFNIMDLHYCTDGQNITLGHTVWVSCTYRPHDLLVHAAYIMHAVRIKN